MRSISELYQELQLWLWRRADAREQAAVLRNVRAIFNNGGPRAKHTARVTNMAAMYASGKSLEEIAQEYNVTRERIRQCVAKFVRVENTEASRS